MVGFERNALRSQFFAGRIKFFAAYADRVGWFGVGIVVSPLRLRGRLESFPTNKPYRSPNYTQQESDTPYNKRQPVPYSTSNGILI